jgi:hypothetical protein
VCNVLLAGSASDGAVVEGLVEVVVKVVVEVVGGEAAVAGVVSVGLPVGLGPGARAGTPRWRYSLSGARPPGGPARAWCERARAGGAGCDGPLLAKRRCLLPLDSRRSVCPQTRRVPVGLRRADLNKDVDAPHGVGVGAVPGTRFQPDTGRSIRRWRTDTTTIYRLPCCPARWHHWLGEPRCPETCFLAARPLICAVTQYAGGDRITQIRAWPLGTGPAAEDRPCAVHVRRRGRCQHSRTVRTAFDGGIACSAMRRSSRPALDRSHQGEGRGWR